MFKIKLINLLALEALLLHILKPMITAYQIIPSTYYTLCVLITCIIIFIKIPMVSILSPFYR